MQILKLQTECNHPDCKNKPKWNVHIKIWAKGFPREVSSPAVIHTPIVVCDEHKEDYVKWKGFFSDKEIRARIYTLFDAMRKALPDLDNPEVEFICLS